MYWCSQYPIVSLEEIFCAWSHNQTLIYVIASWFSAFVRRWSAWCGDTKYCDMLPSWQQVGNIWFQLFQLRLVILIGVLELSTTQTLNWTSLELTRNSFIILEACQSMIKMAANYVLCRAWPNDIGHQRGHPF